MVLLLQSPITEPVRSFATSAAAFLPHLLGMLILLAAGALVGWITGLVLGAVFRAVRFDAFAFRVGLSEILTRAGMRDEPSRILASLVAWVVFLVFLFFGLQALHIPQMDILAAELFQLLPRFLAALFLFAAGAVLSLFLGRAALIAAVNANLGFARGVSMGVRALVLIFFFAVAMEHLQIGRGIVIATFSILFGGVVLALALAFGLGGKDLAKDYLERRARREAEESAQGRKKISYL